MSLPKLREPAAFPGWFRKVVLKHSDRLVRGKQIPTTPLTTANTALLHMESPVTIAERRQLQATIQKAIASLPKDQRLAVTLFYMAGYSQKEMAVYLDVPVSTIKKRLFTARKQLHERMETTMADYLQESRPSQTDNFSKTVQLFLALQVGDNARVNNLLQADPTLINSQCEYQDRLAREFAMWPTGCSPIEWAVSLGRRDLVSTLLNHKADANALQTAVRFQHVDIVDQLLQAGPMLTKQHTTAKRHFMLRLFWVGSISLIACYRPRPAQRSKINQIEHP